MQRCCGTAGGTPAEKADFRDNLIADIANIEQGMRIALIGVVNPLIAAIRKRGGTCLPCDLQMERTQWGDPVEKDMEKVLDSADGVICTGMTLSNGTFDRVVERVLERNIPLTVYAQTGSAVAARFVGNGITSLLAESFPFSQFSATRPVFFATKDKVTRIDSFKNKYRQLVHSNPELYAVFENDKSFEMARFIHAIPQKYETGKKVLDVGSGLGREVAFLREKGYDAVGIDASEDMVAWSQKHYPNANFLYWATGNV